MSQTVNVAKEHPQVFFIAEYDDPVKDHPANLWVIDRNFHVPFYAIGATAAKATKTGKIGYLGGQSLSFSYAEIHAVQQALNDQASSAQLTYVWVGDFNDPTKAREAADAMIGDGIDVIMASLNLGVYGAFEAAKEAPYPVLVTAKYTDKSFFAPQNYVTAALYDYKKPLVEIVDKIMNGETKGIYPLGFDTGVAVQLPLQNISEQVNAEVTQIVADIQSGKIKVIEDTSEIK
jgi:basic membrane protein A